MASIFTELAATLSVAASSTAMPLPKLPAETADTHCVVLPNSSVKVGATSGTISFETHSYRHAVQMTEIDNLSKLKSNWDGDGAPAPTEESARAAKMSLLAMETAGFCFPKILPSVDGGIGLIFDVPGYMLRIEASNDGEVSLLIKNRLDRNSLKGWPFDATAECMDELVEVVREQLQRR